MTLHSPSINTGSPFVPPELKRQIDRKALKDPARLHTILALWPQWCDMLDSIAGPDTDALFPEEFVVVYQTFMQLAFFGVRFDEHFIGWIEGLQQQIPLTDADSDEDGDDEFLDMEDSDEDGSDQWLDLEDSDQDGSDELLDCEDVDLEDDDPSGGDSDEIGGNLI